VAGQPARQAAESSGRAKIALAVVALTLIALAVQLMAAFSFFLYCDENLQPGTAREAVCNAADGGGYLAGILLPPAIILSGGLIAVHRRQMAIIAWMFGAVLAIGIAFPLGTAVIAGYG